MPQIVIVGAGISGLSVAYRLQQLVRDAEVTVLEEAERPGGATWTLREQGFQLEAGPNGFLDTKPATKSLCQDLGLGDQLLAASEDAARNRYLLVGGRLKPASLIAEPTSGRLHVSRGNPCQSTYATYCLR